MQTYIAILRGINVSGKNKIKMAELRSSLEKHGLKSVQTYIQSGNIVFEAEEGKATEMKILISNIILKKWGFEVPTLVLNHKELLSARDENPFWREHPDIDTKQLCVTFMDGVPDKELLEVITVPKGCDDEFQIKEKQIFGYCPGGFGKSKLTNNFFERKLKQVCTTRNWRTINKLIEMVN